MLRELLVIIRPGLRTLAAHGHGIVLKAAHMLAHGGKGVVRGLVGLVPALQREGDSLLLKLAEARIRREENTG